MLRRSFVMTLALLAACTAESRHGAGSRALVLEPLDAPSALGSTEPNLTTTPDGRALLSWIEPAVDSAHALRFATWTREGWSAPATIATRDDFWLNWADIPSLVSLDGGRLAAHWPQRSGGATYDYEVRIAQSFDDGATWSDGIVPHPDSRTGEHGFVSMFARGDSLVAVWLDARGYDSTTAGASRAMTLASARIGRDGELGSLQIVDDRTCDCCQTAAALTSRGPLVVYRDRSDDEIRDIAAVRLDAAGWTAPRAVHDDAWHVEFCPVNGPAVSAQGARAVVAWFTGADSTNRVNVAFSDDAGDSFGPPVRVDEGEPLGRVDVAMLGDGSAIVVWLERSSVDSARVLARHVAGAGTLGPSATVAHTVAARSSGFPRLTRAGDGVLLAWTEQGAAPVVRAALARPR